MHVYDFYTGVLLLLEPKSVALYSSNHLFIFVAYPVNTNLHILPPLASPFRSSFVHSQPLFLSFTPTSATGLSCWPLVFLLPRPRTTGNSGVHTEPYTHLSRVAPLRQRLILCFVHVCRGARLQWQTSTAGIYIPAHLVSIIFSFSFSSQLCFCTKTRSALLMKLPPPPSPSVCLGGGVDAGQEGRFEGFRKWVGKWIGDRMDGWTNGRVDRRPVCHPLRMPDRPCR